MKRCGTNEIINRDAGLKAFITSLKNKSIVSKASINNSSLSIPIVFHVVGNSTVQNYVTDTRILYQLQQLNIDFSGVNSDITSVPSVFQSQKAGDMQISFYTHQIIRKTTTTARYSAGFDAFGGMEPCQESMKYDSLGGSNAIDPENYFNVWICNFTSDGQPPNADNQLLGYAYFPYFKTFGGCYATGDGVVILYNSIGSLANPGSGGSPYNLGRTLVHEAGHYLGLHHIWNDCPDDQCCGVLDIPLQAGPNVGKPTHPHRLGLCSSTGDMFMNYMDYVDDDTYCMFSDSQKNSI